MMIRWLRGRASNLIRSRFLTQPRRGQATIMFALMIVPMLGMTGLAIDGGYYLYARRTTQAAADAAALAGARQLSKWTASKPTQAQAEVEDIVDKNGQGGVNPSVQNCWYVNSSGATIGSGTSCGAPTVSASGVRVTATTTVPTFFLHVIPGAPTSATVTASATALVSRAGGIPADAPFIVCGRNARRTSGSPIDIYTSTNPAQINVLAIGETFIIHGNSVARCGLNNSGFMGLLATNGANVGRSVPGRLVYRTGLSAGPTGDRVAGPGGCSANTQPHYHCVMLLPVAWNSPPPTINPKEFYVPGYAAFEVTGSGNQHTGKLLGSYIISGPGSGVWKRGDGGVITVRLSG